MSLFGSDRPGGSEGPTGPRSADLPGAAEEAAAKAMPGYLQPVMDPELRIVMIEYRLPGDIETRHLGVNFSTVLEWAAMIAEQQATREKQLRQFWQQIVEANGGKPPTPGSGRIVRPG